MLFNWEIHIGTYQKRSHFLLILLVYYYLNEKSKWYLLIISTNFMSKLSNYLRCVNRKYRSNLFASFLFFSVQVIELQVYWTFQILQTEKYLQRELNDKINLLLISPDDGQVYQGNSRNVPSLSCIPLVFSVKHP